MSNFLNYFAAHSAGILMLILCLLVLTLLINWLARIFNKGRFSRTLSTRREDSLRFLISDAAVKIINDFRHLLALVIILIFALALAYALIRAGSQPGDNINNMKEALQAVVATLGGLVGSIIGYYFGESAVSKALEPGANQQQTGGTTPTAPAVQTGSGASDPPPPGTTDAPPLPDDVG